MLDFTKKGDRSYCRTPKEVKNMKKKKKTLSFQIRSGNDL